MEARSFEEIWGETYQWLGMKSELADLAESLKGACLQVENSSHKRGLSPVWPTETMFPDGEGDGAEKQILSKWRIIQQFKDEYLRAIGYSAIAEGFRLHELSNADLEHVNSTLKERELQRISDGLPAMWEIAAETFLGHDWKTQFGK